ncbi:MAG: RIO1 family regulatory kinase/ATPase [Chloroflexota bacterium]
MTKYENHFKYESFEYEPTDRQSHKQMKPRKTKANGRFYPDDIHEMDDGIESWVPTYVRNLDPKHHEREWVINSLGHFYRDNIVSDVTRLVKGGKEANVYCCTGHENSGEALIAAKLYRPRMLRSLKNDAIYKIGRTAVDEGGQAIRNRRERVAIQKKTRFGKRLDFDQWIGTEFRVLEELYEAGAAVPKPIGYHNTTLLMSFIGDEYGSAPTLSEVSIEREEANPLFNALLEDVSIMLNHGYVHGDLSAYNILYWEGELTLIDFPQMVNAHKNPHAYKLFERDISRVCDYFSRFGITHHVKALARSLWHEHMEEE